MKPNFVCGLNFMPHEIGWTAPLPDGRKLFALPISIDIHTREFNNELHGKETLPPPPISAAQANLLNLILGVLPSIIARTEAALIELNKDYDLNFRSSVSDPNIWLPFDMDSPLDWAFVVHRHDEPDFGYHVEFRGAEFINSWSGD